MMIVYTRALILYRRRRFINHLLTYLLTYILYRIACGIAHDNRLRCLLLLVYWIMCVGQGSCKNV